MRITMKQDGNFTESIHDEDYMRPYDRRNLNHHGTVFTGGRRVESLNGEWHFVPDLYDVGFRDSWHRERGRRSDGLPAEPWDYRPDEGRLVTVPGCWNTIDPVFFYFEGTGWYSRRFPRPAAAEGERIILRIGAANQDAKVYLNGRFLGSHLGGSTPFFVELTGLTDGTNELLVAVNNVRTRDRVPMRNTDWFNWGGLYRDVSLIRVPAVFIRDFRISLAPGGGYEALAVRCVLSDSVDGAAVLSIPELGIEAQIPVKKGVGVLTIPARPDLWEPRNPRLYAVSLAFGDDRTEDLVGFRDIRVESRRILLNGREIFLRGISVHEDDARNGKVLTDEDLERRFRHARELGANFMRLAHYPHDERVARKADRDGILLWEEIPVYWAIDFSNPGTYADAENQLGELILRDGNRASVIMWSVGNENQDTDERLSFMMRLADKARELDGTRLVTAACLVNHAKNRIEDRLAAHLDVIGLNEYVGWYVPDFAELEALVKNSDPDRPVIISEFGAGAEAGFHSDGNQLFTEEYQDQVYARQIEIIAGWTTFAG
jgi:beta-glucuronidase